MSEGAAHALQRTVDEITGYRKRTGKLVKGLIAVTVVSILVAALAVYLFFRVHDSDIGNCTAGNQARAQQEQLWQDVLGLAVGPHPTAAGLEFEGKTLADVREAFAAADCSARYPLW